ncbi:MAG TPA: pentapeptide repeat-containing protein, partial [Thermoanaerobaculia bacterium]|nr:pentapeptide repeat-containing protein [Thermoanaerobaculia bacterium]
REEERKLLNELYEELGRLNGEDQAGLTSRLTALGVQQGGKQLDPDLIYQLYERVRYEAEEPPERAWSDEKVGIPEGQALPRGLDPLRRLFNYWDQCMMATVALFRGLGKKPDQENAFKPRTRVIGRFFRTHQVVRDTTIYALLDFSYFPLAGVSLWRVPLAQGKLRGANLKGADLNTAVLIGASLQETNLAEANLHRAILTNASLTGADLRMASLEKADLTGAKLNGADLTGANLTGANLTGADLTGADLTGADLIGADLNRASITEEQLKLTRGRPRRLPDGTEPPK